MLAGLSSTIAVAGAVALSIAASQAAAAPATSAGLAPPVIHETFTPLPCSGARGHRTTLEQIGCAEQRMIRSDVRLNGLAASVFALLPGEAAQGRFVDSERRWLAYRRADCRSMSDAFRGGTEAPLVDARCQATRNDQRITDLISFRSVLRRGDRG